jgi:hypothetical protein
MAANTQTRSRSDLTVPGRPLAPSRAALPIPETAAQAHRAAPARRKEVRS